MSGQTSSVNLNSSEYMTQLIHQGPNAMALLTVSKESALTEARKSVFTASVFHGLAANLTSARAYSAYLTWLAQKFGA